jgi:hypothetical protein
MVGGKKVTITTGSKDRLEHLMRGGLDHHRGLGVEDPIV